VRGPRDYRAFGGQLYRFSESVGWLAMDDALAAKLWARHAAAAADPTDWFHRDAQRLAAELSNAIRAAQQQRQGRAA
jgi:hypothetical protein